MINKELLEMSQKSYSDMVDSDEYHKNSKGKIILVPVERVSNETRRELDDNINALAERLKGYKEEKKRLDNLPKPRNTKKKKKKYRKERDTVLKMIFNNADENNKSLADSGEYDDSYRDIKKRGPAPKNNKKDDKLDTTYGQRFSPVITLLYDNISEFDTIIDMIEDDLEALGAVRSRYKTDQVGNLISAKNAKLSAIKELGSLSKTISDLEYKKEKDEAKDEESDSTKAISAIGVKFLKGSKLDEDNKKKRKSKTRKSRDRYMDDDDDDDDFDDFKKKKKQADKDLADEFTNTIFGKKNKIGLTAHERHIDMEGKYKIVVVADHRDPENSWKFTAVDNKGKEIKGFRDNYKDLLPKKKGSKLVMDLEKMKVRDKITTKTYKLILI